MKKREKTAGQSYMEAQKSEKPETVQDLLETQKAASRNYRDELFNAVGKGKEAYPQEDIFFIEALTRQDRIMVMAEVTTFIPRITCPTPTFNQSVYRYINSEDILEYGWTIPSKRRCLYYLKNPIGTSEGESMLIKFVHELKDGTLEKLAQTLNKEEYQAGLAFVQDDETSSQNEGDSHVR
jgi:hypothetical protein